MSSYYNEANNEWNDLKEIANEFKITDEHVNDVIYEIDKCFREKIKPGIDIKLSAFERLLRQEILKQSVGILYKSPEYKESEDYTIFQYERAMHPERLEQIYKMRIERKPIDLLLFRSCLSAIDSLLKVISSLYKNKENIKIGALVYYFETKSLFSKFYDEKHYKFHYFNKLNEFYNSFTTENFLVYFFEIQDINWFSEKVEIEKVIKSMNGNLNLLPTIIIIDATIGDVELEVNKLLSKVKTKVILFVVRSGLKLDQFGLELSNLGVLEIYCNSHLIPIQQIKDLLISSRTLSGTSIMNNEEIILLNKVFNKEKISIYKNFILKNTHDFYYEICGSHCNQIEKILWGDNSPFILIKLYSNTKKDYQVFLNNWKMYLNKKGTDLILGSSFGFRQIRAEIIERGDDYIIRTSPGKYRGYNYYYSLEYLKGRKDEQIKNIN